MFELLPENVLFVYIVSLFIGAVITIMFVRVKDQRNRSLRNSLVFYFSLLSGSLMKMMYIHYGGIMKLLVIGNVLVFVGYIFLYDLVKKNRQEWKNNDSGSIFLIANYFLFLAFYFIVDSSEILINIIFCIVVFTIASMIIVETFNKRHHLRLLFSSFVLINVLFQILVLLGNTIDFDTFFLPYNIRTELVFVLVCISDFALLYVTYLIMRKPMTESVFLDENNYYQLVKVISHYTKILYASKGFLKLIDEDKKALKSSKFSFIGPKVQAYGNVIKDYVLNCLERGEHYQIEYQLKLPNGKCVWLQEKSNHIEKIDSNKYYVECNVKNVTKEKEIVDSLFIDKETSLYHKNFFLKEMERLDVKRNLPLSILVLSLEGGESNYDYLKNQLSHIIKTECRADDIIAKWNDELFTILLPHTTETETVSIVKRLNMRIENNADFNETTKLLYGKACKYSTVRKIERVYEDAYADMIYYKEKLKQKNILAEVERKFNEINSKINHIIEHSIFVSMYSEKLASKLGVSESIQKRVKYAGLFHDIGKISLKAELLYMRRELNDFEFSRVQKHSIMGAVILEGIEKYKVCSKYVLHHHENYDGSGYPSGLRANEIPLESRIISVVEAYHAMTQSNSLFKEVMDDNAAINELRMNKWTQFDGDLVEIFIKDVLQIC